MKSTLNFLGTWLLTLAVASGLSWSSVAAAEEGEIKVRAPGVQVEGKLPALQNRDNRAIDAAATVQPWRISNIMGAAVKNNTDKSLGTVNDIVMDSEGKVHYVILAHGGVLGVGQKLVAIPLRAVTFHKTEDNGYYAQVNIAPEMLEKTRNFTSDTWPNFSEPEVRRQIDDIFVEAPGAKVNIDR